MDEMEGRLKHLEDTNEKLMVEMENLKALNERLMSENKSLRSSKGAARNVVEGASGPAESTPQQKEGSSTAIRAARLLLVMCLLSQTSSHISTLKSTSIPSRILQTLSSKKLMLALQDRLQMYVDVYIYICNFISLCLSIQVHLVG